jgi:AAA family ATP:ADP antiporter
MELLERRLESVLQRIFNLLELRYSQDDVRMAYRGILSDEQEKRTNAIEFLDILLNPDLKNILIPIVEATILDTSSEEVIENISKNRMSEFECFESILTGKDVRLKLAVLYLINKTGDAKYVRLVAPFIDHKDDGVRDFAKNALEVISKKV